MNGMNYTCVDFSKIATFNFNRKTVKNSITLYVFADASGSSYMFCCCTKYIEELRKMRVKR